jgi:hypothetical protein
MRDPAQDVHTRLACAHSLARNEAPVEVSALDLMTDEQRAQLLVELCVATAGKVSWLTAVADNSSGEVLLNQLTIEQLDAFIAAAQKVRDEKERWRRLCEPVRALPAPSKEFGG